jgi:2-C-methyl-D-erythritol 4-phosphate cytidylyltransferase
MVCEQEQFSVVIVAGGIGSRFNVAAPKQFVSINGETVLFYAVSQFLSHPNIAEVVVVLPLDHLSEVEKLQDRFANCSLFGVAGGETRQESVRCGLKALSPVDKVLIHDGVRPMLSRAIIDRCLDCLHQYVAATPVVPVIDSVVKVEGGEVVGYIDRAQYNRVQTPQGFLLSKLVSWHLRAEMDGVTFTDDCGLALYYGEKVGVFEGDLQNIKLSFPHDLGVIQGLLDCKTSS